MSRPRVSIPWKELREINPNTQGSKTYEQDRLVYALQREKLYRAAWNLCAVRDKEGEKREAKLKKTR